jgi:curli biogenesis system outer membrane secretion channel CsgG
MKTTTIRKTHWLLINLSLAVVLGMASASTASGSKDSLPTIFVAPLDSGMNQAISEELTEMLITELTKLNKFQVLETTALEALREEMKLGTQEEVKLDEKVSKGEWAGAEYMFRGKVTRCGATTNDMGGQGLLRRGNPFDLKINLKKQELQIDWRIVDVARRTILASGRATGENTGVGWTLAGPKGTGSTNDFRDSALGKAMLQAMSKIVSEVRIVSVPPSGRQERIDQKIQQAKTNEADKIAALGRTRGKVLGVSTTGFVYVSLGGNHGLKSGDKLDLYETLEDKDEKGTVLGTEEKWVGELTVEAVLEEAKSKTRWNGPVKPVVGWVVKCP